MTKKKTEEKTDIDIQYQDGMAEFYDWLTENNIPGNFAARLSHQGYLLEGDVIELLGFESKLDNPFRFFCGDPAIYREDLTLTLKRRHDQIKSFDPAKNQIGVLHFITTQAHLLDEALNDAPPVEHKEDLPIIERKENESVESVDRKLQQNPAEETSSVNSEQE